MGNASKKLAEKCTLLSRAEQPAVASCFHAASRNSDRIREDDLTKLWGGMVDPRLLPFLCNFLLGHGPTRRGFADFQRFAELYVFSVRGTLDERVAALYASLGLPESEELPSAPLLEFCTALVSSYMKIYKQSPGRELSLWASKGFAVQRECLAALAEGLCAELPSPATPTAVAHWLQNCSLLSRITEHVFWRLYHVARSGRRPSEEDSGPSSLLPMPMGLTYMPDYPAIIDLSQLLFLTGNLPPELQTEWRFLFSSNIHGESFSTLLGRIMDQGPSVLIVEDSEGHVFGGFAPHSWVLSPNFSGDDNAFLFTLAPQMRIFHATDYNNHYQYLNLHQQTMPNGLMMGGQFGYCGLWLDSTYGAGQSSESCTTYKHYRQLSHDKDFSIRHLEVWGVGEKPLSDVEKGNRSTTSILDCNSESKVMLRLAGREQHSEGLRESSS